MFRRVWLVAGAALLAVILVSVRYAAFVRLSPAHSVGIAAGALVLVDRPVPGAAGAAPVPPGVGSLSSIITLAPKPPPAQRKFVDWYRHGYGFQWAIERRESRLYSPPVVTLEFPLAWVWGVGFALPWACGRWRVTRRRREGRCVGCGYELAGASRCAECGRDGRD